MGIEFFWKYVSKNIIKYIDFDLLNNNQRIKFVNLISSTPTYFGGSLDRVKVGKNVKLTNTFFNVVSGDIYIGDSTFFGHNVFVLTGSHPIDQTMDIRHNYPSFGRDINIGKGVWIASGAIIIGPCTIGDNSVIASGAVVKEGFIEAGYLYAGVPARKIRKLDLKSA
jgi:acetyltransferase-like isoleucine patch superfamily enzyme